jgi:hypothetical protein
MTQDEAKAIVGAYEALLAHALRTLEVISWRGSVEEDTARLRFVDGQVNPMISWSEYESDYYGGGYLAHREVPVQLPLLLLSAEEVEKKIASREADEKERAERLLAAQEAVQRDRQRALELAMYAQLHAKYGPKK